MTSVQKTNNHLLINAPRVVRVEGKPKIHVGNFVLRISLDVIPET